MGDLLIGLDVGSVSTKIVVAEKHEAGPRVVWVDRVPSRGIRRGTVVDAGLVRSVIEAAARQIRQHHSRIDRIMVALPAPLVRKAYLEKAMRSVPGGQVTRKDVAALREDVLRSMMYRGDERLLSAVAVEYGVMVSEAGEPTTRWSREDPVGMRTRRIDAKLQVFTGPKWRVADLLSSIDAAGLTIEKVYLGPMAQAELLTTPDERTSGVCVVDLGGETTDVVVYEGGYVRLVDSIPIGGLDLTENLARRHLIALDHAERLKVSWGCEDHPVEEREAVPTIGLSGGQVEVDSRTMANHLAAMTRRLLGRVAEVVEQNIPLENLEAGVVFTGGTASMRGLLDLAGEVFAPGTVRMASTARLDGLRDLVGDDTRYTVAAGTVDMAARGELGPRTKRRDWFPSLRTFKRWGTLVTEMLS